MVLCILFIYPPNGEHKGKWGRKPHFVTQLTPLFSRTSLQTLVLILKLNNKCLFMQKKEQLWNVPNYDCWKQFFWQVNKEKVFKEEAPTTAAVRHLTALREWIICKILGGHNFWVILHFFACVIIFMQSAAAKMLNTYLICCHLIEFDVINCGASAIWQRIFFICQVLHFQMK